MDGRINSRKILAGLAETVRNADKLTDITVAIDKLDKVGLEKVKEELIEKNINEQQVGLIIQYLSIAGSNTENRFPLPEYWGPQTAL